MKNKITVFALSASQELGKDICDVLGTELGECKVSHFADGEILVITDALKRASAREITAVIPYFGYARQDRKAKPRQPITSRLVADLLSVAGVDRVVTVDLHARQIQGFFDIPVDEMEALPLLYKYFSEKNMEDLCVVSPDHGGAVRARKLSEKLDCPIAIIDKRRPKPNVAEVMGIIGDVAGKNCILVDDMIDTAGTICAGANVLMEKGAKSVHIACTHGVLSGPASERLQNCAAEEVVITDTIVIPEEKKFDKLVQVTVADLLAHTIENIENDLPVSEVFELYNF